MDNSNNAWAYPPAPASPGYAPPPPPPPPKGLLAPPQGKSRGLALAMVCLMALAQLTSVVIANFGLNDFASGILSSPLQLGVAAMNLLLTLLVFLKCVLPGWDPHRKTLGWLLGVWALGFLASSIYGIIQGFQIVSDSLAGSGFGVAGIGGAIGGAIGALYGIVLSPQGILLFGVLAKKSTEKVAGLVSAVSCGISLLGIPLLLIAGRFLSGLAESGLLYEDFPLDILSGTLFSGTMLTSTIAGLVLSLCWAVFLFTWPVLERPVLEKTV